VYKKDRTQNYDRWRTSYMVHYSACRIILCQL